MALTITLEQGHALVGAVAVASGLVATWLGVNVGKARRRFEVKVRRQRIAWRWPGKSVATAALTIG